MEWKVVVLIPGYVLGWLSDAPGPRLNSLATYPLTPAITVTVLPIHDISYTVVFARDMAAMRAFYADVMRFPIQRELGPQWIEYRVGSNLLALTSRGLMFDDPAPPRGALSMQLAFRVAPSEVAACAQLLCDRGVALAGEPTDQPWGHRTLFFRDPDGNVLEIYAEL